MSEDGSSLSRYFGGSNLQPASNFFVDLTTNEASETPQTPLDNSLANIGNPDKLPPRVNLNQEPTVCSLFSQGSQNMNPNQASSFTSLNQPLPDPSTFFDSIGTTSMKMMDQPFTEPLNASIEIPLEKLNIQDSIPSIGEADRRRDAWIPSDKTKKILVQAQTSPAGSFFPEKEILTMPGIILETDLGDDLYNVVAHHLGEEEAVQRGSWGYEHVTQDERGLKELIQTGCFRAAINLTTRLLTNYGQGIKRAGHPSKHSPRSLQLWFTRLALLVKIQSYSLCELEAEAFGNLQNPDIYFQFYPDIYPNRSGSMASFSFRLLLAELPMYTNKPELAMARLYGVLGVIKKMIKYLRESKCEEGTDRALSLQDRQESLKLWSGREARVKFSIVNSALQMKDYFTAILIVEEMAANPSWGVSHTRALYSALGRICLQAGHIMGAEANFKKSTQIRITISPEQDVRELVDHSLLAVANNAFGEAHNCLLKASLLEPANIMVLNNMAVCLLYSGKLKDAIGVMEKAVNSNPTRGLGESLLLNLCTLYELESSNTMTKKLALLQQLSKYKRDTVANVTICLKLNT